MVLIEREISPDDCPRCYGDGRVANDDEGTPWVHWLDLPVKNALAITMGVVRPVACPACDGTGKKTPQDTT